jgi:hypothetical protein
MQTLTIYGRDFTVEKIEGKHTQYLLHGTRGATYGVVETVRYPGYYFLVNLKGAVKVDPLGRLALTVIDGELQVV